MFNFFHDIAGKIALGISSILIGVAGFISPLPKTEPVQIIPIATSVVEATTTTKIAAPEKIKVVETSAPKKVVPVVIPVTVNNPTLQIEKCKAQRDSQRGQMWPLALEAVKTAEQKSQKATMDYFMATYAGTVPASVLSSQFKISDAEHEKNLQTAQAIMEQSLAKTYEACLSSIQ